MNKEYKILRMDAILTGNSITLVPIIYIQPDIAFIEYIKLNNFMIMCQIQGTCTIYDNKLIAGIVNKSSEVPNCRPNFFEETGSYIITLMAPWNGYTKNCQLGTVTFLNLDDLKRTETCNEELVEASCDPCNYINNDRTIMRLIAVE